MKWRTHIRLANAAIDETGLLFTDDEMRCLADGVVYPDRDLKDWPHHYNVSQKIQVNLWQARRAYLRGNNEEACFFLGVALHYLQDSYTSYPSKMPKHDKWEQWIEEAYIVNDVLLLIEKTDMSSFKKRRCCSQAEKLSSMAYGPYETMKLSSLNDHTKEGELIMNWKVDLNLAYLATKAVTVSVLGSKSDPSLENECAKIRNKHLKIMLASEKATSEKILQLIEKIARKEEINELSPGLISRIRGLFSKVSISLMKSNLTRMQDNYHKRNHIQKYIRNGHRKIIAAVDLEEGWFITFVPVLTPDEVPKLL